MRFPETTSQEERFASLLHPFQVTNSSVCKFPIIIGSIRNISRFTKRSPHRFRINRFSRFRIHPKFPFIIFRPIYIISIRMIPVRRLTPRIRMIADMMKHLAVRNSMITIPGEPSRNRYCFGTIFAGIGGKTNKAIGVMRIYTRQ